ncbi:4Fe-4S binding protein [Thermodesulfobacterium hveragerdense]|uniref:4Fe-4S binding protein n=1 Tax=Thermodesulfobacterium hveragerdense TaxID=53424 RepID=UPI0003FC0AC0|nr:4Fe-4S binding protein [Thermodesulfobacterium hveragerdense]
MENTKDQIKNLSLHLIKDYGLQLLDFKGEILKIDEALSSGKTIDFTKPENLLFLAQSLGLDSSLPERILLTKITQTLIDLFSTKDLTEKVEKFFPAEVLSKLKKEGLLLKGIEREIVHTYENFLRAEEKEELVKSLVKLSLTYVFGLALFRSYLKDLGVSEGDSNGLTCADLMYALGGTFRASLSPINENLKAGNIKGLVFFYHLTLEEPYLSLVKNLLNQNIWIWSAGNERETLKCLDLIKEAGEGLRQFLESFGLPPVLWLRNEVEIFSVVLEMLSAGGLVKEISEIPLVAVYCSKNGLETVNPGLLVPAFLGLGLEVLAIGKDFLPFKLLDEKVKVFEEGLTDQILQEIIDRIETKRKTLGIHQPKPRVLFDMEMRRSLSFSERMSFCQQLLLERFKNSLSSKLLPFKRVQLIRERCINCFNCVKICPFSAMSINHVANRIVVDLKKCTGCGICIGECPSEAIYLQVI